MRVKFPGQMRVLGIERYIKDHIFTEHWAGQFNTTYIFVDKFRFSPYNPEAIKEIISQKRGCLTCRAPDCPVWQVADRPVWQAADQNCWKSQTVPRCSSCLPGTPLCDECYKEQIQHDAATRAEERESVLVEGVAKIQERIDGIYQAYHGEARQSLTKVPYAMANGMGEAINILISLRSSTPLPEDAGKDGEL
jgi:hypothetical protein